MAQDHGEQKFSGVERIIRMKRSDMKEGEKINQVLKETDKTSMYWPIHYGNVFMSSSDPSKFHHQSGCL